MKNRKTERTKSGIKEYDLRRRIEQERINGIMIAEESGSSSAKSRYCIASAIRQLSDVILYCFEPRVITKEESKRGDLGPIQYDSEEFWGDAAPKLTYDVITFRYELPDDEDWSELRLEVHEEFPKVATMFVRAWAALTAVGCPNPTQFTRIITMNGNELAPWETCRAGYTYWLRA